MPPNASSDALDFSDDGLLTIVTLYEDEAALHRARRTIERVVEGVPSNAVVRTRAWSFASLGDHDEGPELGGWLPSADIIVVAARRDRQAPPVVADRLSAFIESDDKDPRAFVALGMVPQDGTQGPERLFGSLKPLADQLGMRYFHSTVSLPLNAGPYAKR